MPRGIPNRKLKARLDDLERAKKCDHGSCDKKADDGYCHNPCCTGELAFCKEHSHAQYWHEGVPVKCMYCHATTDLDTGNPVCQKCINTHPDCADIRADIRDAEGEPEFRTTEELLPDMVNHPSHYNVGGIECIDALEAMLTEEEFVGFLKGQVVKYLWRADHKGARVQDEAKAKWYQDRLVSFRKKKGE